MSDLISRQAAIDAIMGQPPEPHYPSWYAAQIENLPPAQPSVSKTEIVGDVISRQVAIEALADMHCKSDEDGYVWIIRSDAWARIDALPSVTPKRKTGKWIKQDCGGVEYTAVCSECGYGTFWRYALDFDFCPKCGSYNGGEQDE